MVDFLLYSDVHREFDREYGRDWFVPTTGNDGHYGVVLAGDIDVAKKRGHHVYPFLKDLSERFKFVIYVAGNHEFYHGAIEKVQKYIREDIADLKNVHFMEDQSIVVDDVLFIGSTLWTDYNEWNPMTVMLADRMNDYHQIATTPNGVAFSKVKPRDLFRRHIHSRDYIFNEIERGRESCRKIVVVTHHAPSFASLDPMYASDPMNPFYASELSEMILDGGPDLWVHGHTHCSNDYVIGNTRIVLNPRGYVNKDFEVENEEWIEHLILTA